MFAYANLIRLLMCWLYLSRESKITLNFFTLSVDFIRCPSSVICESFIWLWNTVCQYNHERSLLCVQIQWVTKCEFYQRDQCLYWFLVRYRQACKESMIACRLHRNWFYSFLFVCTYLRYKEWTEFEIKFQECIWTKCHLNKIWQHKDYENSAWNQHCLKKYHT